MSLFGQITVGQIATGLHLKKFKQPGPKKVSKNYFRLTLTTGVLADFFILAEPEL